MASLAEAFVNGIATEGHHFDYAVANAARLDAVVDLFLASQPGKNDVHSMQALMGAYVGELITRNGGGRWRYSLEVDAPSVILTSGLQAFPTFKVAKRLHVGSEHSIAQFIETSMSGVLPPGARRMKH
jgi:hypothetical protein